MTRSPDSHCWSVVGEAELELSVTDGALVLGDTDLVRVLGGEECGL